MKPLILVADDEKNTREGLKWALESRDLGVALAADGQKALENVREASPDIVIADLKMPGLDGMELLKKVKRESPQTFC